MYFCNRRCGPGGCIQFRCKRRERRGSCSIRKVSLSGLTRKVCFRRCSLHTLSFEVRLEDKSLADDSKHLEVERSFAAPWHLCSKVHSRTVLQLWVYILSTVPSYRWDRWDPADFGDFRWLSAPSLVWINSAVFKQERHVCLSVGCSACLR